jgi:SAM-dependent methyltransferase
MNTNGHSQHVKARDFAGLNATLGWGRAVRGLDYVRCLEFPLVFEALELAPGQRILDVGSRTSIFPLFAAVKEEVEVHATDLDPEVDRLQEHVDRLGGRMRGTVVVRQADLRDLPYPDDHFDGVTCISVIEHVPGEGDSEGMRDLARVLKPGGRLVVTVPFGMTERDFFLDETVYSEGYSGEPVFFQRHYTPETLESRLIGPSGLTVLRRGYFGEGGFPFFNRFWVLPPWIKPVKAAYAWASPFFAGRFMDTYDSPAPLTLQSPPMITANGAWFVLTKEA